MQRFKGTLGTSTTSGKRQGCHLRERGLVLLPNVHSQLLKKSICPRSCPEVLYFMAKAIWHIKAPPKVRSFRVWVSEVREIEQ